MFKIFQQKSFVFPYTGYKTYPCNKKLRFMQNPDSWMLLLLLIPISSNNTSFLFLNAGWYMISKVASSFYSLRMWKIVLFYRVELKFSLFTVYCHWKKKEATTVINIPLFPIDKWKCSLLRNILKNL